MKGVVIKSTGKWCQVLDEAGEVSNCTVKGKFRIQGLRTTNPVAVGDKVDYDETDPGEGVITAIEDRKNYIVRKSVNLSKQVHIIASNIDMCWLLITLEQPVTSTGFIDRVLLTAEAFNVPITLVFNKVDLLDGGKENEKLFNLVEGYEKAGYKSHAISVETGLGIDELKQQMHEKVNMFSGHSGVGKSSLANLIQENLDLRTMDVSDHHGKGQHTTTFAEMHKLDFGGYLIDTPGIKGFGIIDIDREELGHYFPEMFSRLAECKFHNCRHLNEPGCAVVKAVENEEVASFRYENYKNIYQAMGEDQNYRIDPYK